MYRSTVKPIFPYNLSSSVKKVDPAVPQRQNATITATCPMATLIQHRRNRISITNISFNPSQTIRETELSCRSLVMQAFESSVSLRCTRANRGSGYVVNHSTYSAAPRPRLRAISWTDRPRGDQCSSSPVYHITRIHVAQTLRWAASSIGKYITPLTLPPFPPFSAASSFPPSEPRRAKNSESKLGSHFD